MKPQGAADTSMVPVNCSAQEMDMRSRTGSQASEERDITHIPKGQRAPSRLDVPWKLELAEVKPGVLRTCLGGHSGQGRLWIDNTVLYLCCKSFYFHFMLH